MIRLPSPRIFQLFRIAGVAALLCSDGIAAETFKNPVAISGADPFVVYDDGWYYFTATAGSRLDIRKTRRLGDLDKTRRVTVWRAPRSGPNSRSIWAPEIHKIDGHWWIYYTATTEDGSDANRRIFVLQSETADPMGPYREKGKLAVPGDDHYAIDATVFRHTDGKLYCLWSGREKSEAGPQNIYIAPMSDPATISGPRILLSTPEYDWEKHGWEVNEGPAVLQRDGRTFVAYSGSGYLTPNYCLGLLTNLDGNLLNAASWTKSPRPVFQSVVKEQGQVYGPGHNAFFKSPDGREDWNIYHARPHPEPRRNDRSARAQPVKWNEKGMPVFGEPVLPGVEIPVPSGEGAD